MLNFRKIDRFYLSGGWDNLPENINLLKLNKIKAVLDLQFISQKESETASRYIKEKLGDIQYYALAMYDSEFNNDLGAILDFGHECLEKLEEKFPNKNDGILVKCAAGISRSPAMLINHLCISRRMNYAEALNYLRDKESAQGIDFGSSPNEFFAQYLREKYK